jgi:N-acetylneuraminic acid mutarotase
MRASCWRNFSELGLVIMVSSPVSTLADETLQWSLSTPMPEPRSDYSAGVVDGKLIVAGGTFWSGTKGHWIKKHFSPSTHAFDPRTKTWEKLPDLPVALGLAGGAVVGGRFFVVGGYTGSAVNRKIYVLEKRQSQWAWKEFGDVPIERVYARAIGIGNSLYLVGGTTKFEPRDPTGTCCTSKTATRTLLVLNVDHPQEGWRDLPPFPGESRFYFNAETDGKDIWMFGGIYQAVPSDPIKAFADVCRYDVPRGKWESMQPTPRTSTEGNAPSPVFVGDGFVIMNDFKTVWKLDPTGKQYRELASLPEAAQVDRYVWLNHEIIGASGENFIESARRRSEWVFIGRPVAK